MLSITPKPSAVYYADKNEPKRAAVHLARNSGLPCAARKELATSESREVYAPFLGVLRRVA